MTTTAVLAAILVVIACVIACLFVPDYEPQAGAGERTNVDLSGPRVANLATGTVDSGTIVSDATVRTVAATDAPAPRRGWRLGKAAEPRPRLPPQLTVHVLTVNGNPVPGATVAVYDLDLHVDRAGVAVPQNRRAVGGQRFSTSTAPDGIATLPIAGDCLVSAHHAGIGCSGDHRLMTGRAVPDVLRLVLLPTATVRGRVLLADGCPAGGATIHYSAQTLEEATGDRALLVADVDGRFGVEVLAGVPYTFQAVHQSRYSDHLLERSFAAGEVRDITLSFSGAYSVRGLVLDAAGRPIVASFRLRDIGNPADFGLLRGGKSDAEGRFAVELAHPGSYCVVAGSQGLTAASAEMRLDAANPHAQVVLTLRPLLEVAGRVVDERGEPCVGVNVHLEDAGATTTDGFVLGMMISLQGNDRATTTDSAGRFRLSAPSGGRCRVGLHLIAKPWLMIPGVEVSVPATDLTIVARDADKQGFELGGTVVAASTGVPVGDIRIGLAYAGAAKSPAVGTGSDGAFLVGPFTPGRDYSFVVEAIGFAPAVVGPFAATTRREQVTVRLQAWAKVNCRVLRADGTPAAYASTQLECDPQVVGLARTWQGETDAAGCITFRNVIPSRYRVLAWPTRHAPSATVDTAVARPGESIDVQIVLAK